MQHPPSPYGHAPPPKKQSFPVWIIVLLVAVPVLVAGVGVFAVIAIYGVRKYVSNAKTTEARSTLRTLATHAEQAYAENHKLCPSASRPVPVSVPHAAKYQSTASDWIADSKEGAGYPCLKFSMAIPQYYSYEYSATDDTFTARATGDLNGDGVTSTFTLGGRVENGVVVTDPAIREDSPDE